MYHVCGVCVYVFSGRDIWNRNGALINVGAICVSHKFHVISTPSIICSQHARNNGKMENQMMLSF